MRNRIFYELFEKINKKQKKIFYLGPVEQFNLTVVCQFYNVLSISVEKLVRETGPLHGLCSNFDRNKHG